MYSSSQRFVFLLFAALVAISCVTARSNARDFHLDIHARHEAERANLLGERSPLKIPGTKPKPKPKPTPAEPTPAKPTVAKPTPPTPTKKPETATHKTPTHSATPTPTTVLCTPQSCRSAKACAIGKAPKKGAKTSLKPRNVLERSLSSLQPRGFAKTVKPNTYLPNKIGLQNKNFVPAVFDSAEDAISTAVLEKFGDVDLDVGVMHLTGCTSMIIVSDQAVYFTHYWESLAFSPKGGKKAKDAGFSSQVLIGLLEGQSYGDSDESAVVVQPSLEDNKALFAGAKVFVMTPAASLTSSAQLYKAEIALLETTVKNILGATTPFKVQTYKKPETGKKPHVQTGADGMALFQYSKTGAKRATRVFIEQTEVYTNNW